MFICNVFLTFIIKRLITGIHKTFLKHSFFHGFHTHHFLTFAKRLQYPKMFTGMDNANINQLIYIYNCPSRHS